MVSQPRWESIFVHFSDLPYSEHSLSFLCLSLSRHSAPRQDRPIYTAPDLGSQRSESPVTLVKREAGPEEPPNPDSCMLTPSILCTCSRPPSLGFPGPAGETHASCHFWLRCSAARCCPTCKGASWWPPSSLASKLGGRPLYTHTLAAPGRPRRLQEPSVPSHPNRVPGCFSWQVDSQCFCFFPLK